MSIFPLSKTMKNPIGKIIISILLGIGLASLFRKICREKNCTIKMAPPLKDINDKTVQIDDKCYKFQSKQSSCNKQTHTQNQSKKIIYPFSI